MKRLLLFTLTAFACSLFLFSSCKKNPAPDDIPDWLKEKIHAIEKSHDCYGNVAPKIWEIKNDTTNEVLYKIWKHTDPNSYEYYKTDGTLICECGVVSCGGCGSYGYFGSHWIEQRLIWEDKSSKCR